jgi:hypothetical protein
MLLLFAAIALGACAGVASAIVWLAFHIRISFVP